MRRFYEGKDYNDYMFDIEDDFQHDLYDALYSVVLSYSRKLGIEPFELLDRYIDITISRLKDDF